MPARVCLAVVTLALPWLLFQTADRGGALVFHHAVAVALPAPPPSPPAPPPIGRDDLPVARLVTNPDGRVTWRPLPGDSGALGSVVTAPAGSDLAAVEALEVVPAAGLALRVDGRAMLVLAGTHDDVQVDVGVDLSGFDGTVGALHHVRGADDAGVFSVRTDGTATLATLSPGGPRTLDTASITLPRGPVTIAASAAGRHLKGLVDGQTVTHGHVAPGEAGAGGILLDGSGEIRLLAVEVTPLEGH